MKSFVPCGGVALGNRTQLSETVGILQESEETVMKPMETECLYVHACV